MVQLREKGPVENKVAEKYNFNEVAEIAKLNQLIRYNNHRSDTSLKQESGI